MEYHDFGWALNKLRQGLKVTRTGWNGKDMFVYFVQGSNFVVNRLPLTSILPEGTAVQYRPHLDMKYADGTFGVWLASQSDLLGEDWEVVD